MAKIKIKAVPKMQTGGYAPLTSQERDAWERMQSAAYEQGFLGSEHNRQPGVDFMRQYGVDPNRLSAYQADLLEQRNVAPWGRPGAYMAKGPETTFSNIDTFYGPKTARERYGQYSVKEGNKPAVNFGTDWKAATAYSNQLEAARQAEYKDYGKPEANINYQAPEAPVTTPAPRATGLAATGFPTREEATAKYKARKASGQELPSNYFIGKGNADYSIDSLRRTGKGSDEFAYGGSTKKIRISGVPTMATGGYANKDASHGYGNQQVGQGYALNRFWNTPAGYPFTTSKVNPYGKVGNTLPEAKDGGDINAEKQEMVLGDFDQDGQQELMNVDGPPHTQGGKDVNVPSNSFVFSDTKDLKIKDPQILAMFGMAPKRGGYTPAQIAKKYDLNKFKKILDDPNADDASKKTAQLMNDNYLSKLNRLASVQESMKGAMGMEHHDPQRGQVPAEEAPVQEVGNMGQGGEEMMQPEVMAMRYGGIPHYQIGGGNTSSDDQEYGANESMAMDEEYIENPDGSYSIRPATTVAPINNTPSFTDNPFPGQAVTLTSPGYPAGNYFKGYPKQKAQELIKKYGKGHDNIPYSDNIAAGIGYTKELADKYGHNWTGVQNWERSVQPGYKVSPGTGLPEGKGGIRTLSPSLPYGQVDPWVNPHDIPAMPGLVNREQIDRLPVIVPTEHPVVNVVDPFPTIPQTEEETKKEKNKKAKEGKQRRGIFMNPNLYGDAMNLAQMAQLRKFVPYEPVPQAVIPETVFMDPTRAIAAQQEMARNAMEMAGQSANARAARATGLAYQGEAGKQAADTIAQYANQNVAIANQANAQAAQITNQLMAMEANRLAELNKGNFLAARDYQREMGRLQAEWADRKQKQHDTAVKTAWLNKTSPYFNIDPYTQMPVFKPGDAEARYWKDIKGGSDGNFPDMISKLMSEKGWSFEQALAALTKGTGTVKTQHTDPVTGDKTTSTGTAAGKYGGMMRYGGSHMAMPEMAPYYQIGGNFISLAGGPDVSFNAVDNTAYTMPVQSTEPLEIETEQSPLKGLSSKKASKRDIATITNNPGNMIYSPKFGKLFGAVDSGIKQRDGKGHFAMFPDLNTGFKAYQTQLFGEVDGVMKSNYYKKDTTVNQALKTWSNNGYDGSIYPEVKNKKLSELTMAERNELAKRQIKHESGDMYKLLRERGVFKKYGGSALQKFIR